MSKILESALIEVVAYSQLGSRVSESVDKKISRLIEAITNKKYGVIYEAASPDEIRKFTQEVKDGNYNESKARRILSGMTIKTVGFKELFDALSDFVKKENGGNKKVLTPNIISVIGAVYPILNKEINYTLSRNTLPVIIRNRDGKVISSELMKDVRKVVDDYVQKRNPSPLTIRMEAILNALMDKRENASISGAMFAGLMHALPKAARFYQHKIDRYSDLKGLDGSVNDLDKLPSGGFSGFEFKIPSKEMLAIQYIAKILSSMSKSLTPRHIENYFLIPFKYEKCSKFANMLTFLDKPTQEPTTNAEMAKEDKRLEFLSTIFDDYAINPQSIDKTQVYNTKNRTIAFLLNTAIQKGLLGDFESKFELPLENISRILCTGANEKFRIDRTIRNMEKNDEFQDEDGEDYNDYEDSVDPSDYGGYKSIEGSSEETPEDEPEVQIAKPEKFSVEKLSPSQRAAHITMALTKTSNPSGMISKYEKYLGDLSDEQRKKILAVHPSLSDALSPMISESTKNRWKLLSGISKTISE